MKKTLFLLVALCLTIALADARTVRKVYEIDDFTALNVTNAFEVTLEHADEFRVEIEISEEFLPYLLVKNRGGVLELNFTRLPFRLKQKARSRIAQAIVRMPVVTDITLSGASKLSCNDQFSNTMNRFSIDLRGGSQITNLNVKAPEVAIKLAGASKAVVSLRSSDVDVDLSGASKLEVEGDTQELDVKVSGASTVSAENFDAADVSVIAKGASKVDVMVTETLSVTLSGASKCRYYGDSDYVKVKADQIGGGSSLKQMKK
jgi:hypothetical protein